MKISLQSKGRALAIKNNSKVVVDVSNSSLGVFEYHGSEFYVVENQAVSIPFCISTIYY
jgi:hypothetical protein